MMRRFITSTRSRQAVISIDCLCLIITFYVQPSLIHMKLTSGWMMIPLCLQNHVLFISELHEKKRVKKQKKVNCLIYCFFPKIIISISLIESFYKKTNKTVRYLQLFMFDCGNLGDFASNIFSKEVLFED